MSTVSESASVDPTEILGARVDYDLGAALLGVWMSLYNSKDPLTINTIARFDKIQDHTNTFVEHAHFWDLGTSYFVNFVIFVKFTKKLSPKPQKWLCSRKVFVWSWILSNRAMVLMVKGKCWVRALTLTWGLPY